MKLPVWTLELLRDTDAPFERVVEKLMDGGRYREWHPRLSNASPRMLINDGTRAEIEHRDAPVPGVEEVSRYVVQVQGDRVILVYSGRFKGLPVLVLMPYWRFASERLWERFVESL